MKINYKPAFRIHFPILLFFMAWSVAVAQTNSASQNQKAPSIQDNSFLMEEAYNQEPGVVQHINGFMKSLRGSGWVYSFTQEWPVFGQKHQFSYTLPIQRVNASPTALTGLGDIALNYRYQLVGDGEAKVAISPRFSVLLPTGDREKGLGLGTVGVQVNLPVSVVISDKVVTHWNAGATYLPSAKNSLSEKANLKGFNLGQSTIWLVKPSLNLMLETVWNRFESVAGRSLRDHENSWLVSPGVRWAYNFESGLQIVPGIAVPIGVGPSRGDVSLFVYLSFEHPFGRKKK